MLKTKRNKLQYFLLKSAMLSPTYLPETKHLLTTYTIIFAKDISITPLCLVICIYLFTYGKKTDFVILITAEAINFNILKHSKTFLLQKHRKFYYYWTSMPGLHLLPIIGCWLLRRPLAFHPNLIQLWAVLTTVFPFILNFLALTVEGKNLKHFGVPPATAWKNSSYLTYIGRFRVLSV